MLATAVWFESLCEPVAFGANAQTEDRNRDPSLTRQVVRHRLEPGSIAFRARTQTLARFRDLSMLVRFRIVLDQFVHHTNSHIGIQAFAYRVSPQTEARSRDPKLLSWLVLVQ
ncbi:hypothetical protein DPMN_013199 [Dreissena polymorpha]|uniref:Uncharacterized protein n=1 Tax=Dreissena polymorpha TaxID=45954 RepID=A0A9D4N8H3_DREPO|nr:hypothetical protein DPMN_013199 [Dreissena polymorpha]